MLMWHDVYANILNLERGEHHGRVRSNDKIKEHKELEERRLKYNGRFVINRFADSLLSIHLFWIC
jgi:hypothetical protein